MDPDQPYAPPRVGPSAHPPEYPYAELRHSGFGIASFVLSILIGIGFFVLFIVAGVIEANTPGGMDEESTAAIAVGLLLFFGMFSSLVAIVLGFVGVFQQNRKKVFAILGIAFNSMIILGTIGLVILGLAISAAPV